MTHWLLFRYEGAILFCVLEGVFVKIDYFSPNGVASSKDPISKNFFKMELQQVHLVTSRTVNYFCFRVYYVFVNTIRAQIRLRVASLLSYIRQHCLIAYDAVIKWLTSSAYFMTYLLSFGKNSIIGFTA